MKPISSTNSENIFCPHCGKENMSYAKYCSGCGREIPKDSVNELNHNLNYRSQSAVQSSKVTKRKSYWRLLFLIAIIALFIYTNPNEKKHIDFVKEKIIKKLNSGETFEPEIIRLVKSGKNDDQSSILLKKYIKRKNYSLFSLTEVKTEDKFAVISIGILGYMIDLEWVDKIKMDDSVLFLLIVLGGFVILWVLPILIILKSGKTSCGEKVAWVLAVIFISWFAFIFYLLLAPIKKRKNKI